MSDDHELQRLAKSCYDLEEMKEVELKSTKQEHQRAQTELIVHEHPNICRSYPLEPSAAPNHLLEPPPKEHQSEQERNKQQQNAIFSYIGGQKREDLYSLEDEDCQQKLEEIANLHTQLEHQELKKTTAEINCRILEFHIQRMQLDLRDHCNEPQAQQQPPSLNIPAPQMAPQYPKAPVHQTGIAVPAPSQTVSRNPNTFASLESPTKDQFPIEGCEAPPTMAESISQADSAGTDLTTSASPPSPSPKLVATVLAEPAGLVVTVHAEPAASAVAKKSRQKKSTLPSRSFSAGSCPKGSRCSFLRIQEPNTCTSSVTNAKSRQQNRGASVPNKNTVQNLLVFCSRILKESLESPTRDQLFPIEGCEAPPTKVESVPQADSAVTDLTTSASPSSKSPGLVVTVLAEPAGLVVTVLTKPAASAVPKKRKQKKKSNYRNIPCGFFFAGSCSKGSRCSFLHIKKPNTCTSSATNAKSREQTRGANVPDKNMVQTLVAFCSRILKESLESPTRDQFPIEGCEAPPTKVEVTELTTSASPTSTSPRLVVTVLAEPVGLVVTVLNEPAASAVPKKRKQKKKSNYRTVPCTIFSVGSCPKGSRCSFLHIQEPNTRTSSVTNVKSRQKARGANVPNKNMKGSVTRGKKTKDPAQKRMCFYFMNCMSCPRSKCKLSHTMSNIEAK